MKTLTLMSAVILAAIFQFGNLNARDILGNGKLKIELAKLKSGVKISSIKKGNSELLDVGTLSPLFACNINQESVTSARGWKTVNIVNRGTLCTITLQTPSSNKLPKTLKAVITINVTGKKSDWGLAISGLGRRHSLMDIKFPSINILAKGNDSFLIPRHCGKVIKNPRQAKLNVALQYPRWAASMQFMAYYNRDYGIYLGVHDPKAGIKVLVAKANGGNGVKFQANIPVPDRTINGNDWVYPGKFRLELFNGNWYDAALIYRKWASHEADYWPKDTPARVARRKASGNINVWMYLPDEKYSMKQIRAMVNKFANYMGVPIGVHWYQWNYKKMDDDYPYFFPEKSGMGKLVKSMQSKGNVTFMPYINGRLYDKDLPKYNSEGKVWAVKQLGGKIKSQTFNGEHFAVECPTQIGYQKLMAYAAKRLTGSSQIGCGALYIDQVAYAMFLPCYDKKHGHKIGGGSFWRDGYKAMFEKMHAATGSDKFMTSEGNCDFIADEMDSFLAQMWRDPGLVPAFQAVYNGKVHYFGTKGGTSGTTKFYSMYANSFVNGVAPGRFYISAITRDIAPYIRRMARIRNKLKEYLAFGRMLKPLAIDLTNIPKVTSNWGKGKVIISALQSSFWLNRHKNKTMVLFANASKSDSISFTVKFTGAAHGLYGNLKIQKITETKNGPVISKGNKFSLKITLKPKDIIAYTIEANKLATVAQRKPYLKKTTLDPSL